MMDPSARARLLEKSPFGGLGEGISRLGPLFAERRHSAGALIFSEGDPGGQFFVLASGRLRAYRTLPGGHEITVFVLHPGASFGFLSLLDGGPFPVSVAAMDASVSLVLERAAFQRFLRKEPEFGLRLLAHLASRLRGCLDQLGMLGQPGAHARAAHGLLSLAQPETAGAGGGQRHASLQPAGAGANSPRDPREPLEGVRKAPPGGAARKAGSAALPDPLPRRVAPRRRRRLTAGFQTSARS